jgi:hypothetical protein
VSTWLVVWLLISTVATVAVLACLVALVRHLMVLGRAARQLRETLGPMAQEVSREGNRAATRAQNLQRPGSKPPSR